MSKEKELIDKLIDLAFAEDIGDGDHTTLSCIPATAMGKSKLLIKEAGVLAGIEVAKEIFNRFDPSMKVEVFINDGRYVFSSRIYPVGSLDFRINAAADNEDGSLEISSPAASFFAL